MKTDERNRDNLALAALVAAPVLVYLVASGGTYLLFLLCEAQ